MCPWVHAPTITAMVRLTRLDSPQGSEPAAPVALSIAPHPDDEVLGASAACLLLSRAGYRVVVLACTLGREHQVQRRRAELVAASRVAGFEAWTSDPPLIVQRGAAESQAMLPELTALIRAAVDEFAPQLLIGAHPHDIHPLHEASAAATLRAVDDRKPLRLRWWLWSVWGQLVLPSIYVPVNEVDLTHMSRILSEHVGELERNDYSALLRGRAAANVAVGSELVFGFGSSRAAVEPYAELLTELLLTREDGWRFGAPRVLREESITPDAETSVVPPEFFEASLASRLRAPRR